MSKYISNDISKINFPGRQQLPDGYMVIFDKNDEHYHWVESSTGKCGDGAASRWQSWRGAWKHFRETYS